MKRIAWIFCAAGMLLCTSCAPKAPDTSTASVRTDTGTVKHFEVKDQDGALLLTVTAQRPNVGAWLSGKAQEAAQDYYDADYKAARAWWEGELSDFAREDRAMADAQGIEFRAYSVSENFQVMRDDDQFLSLLRISESYTGGAHDNQAVSAETFRKQDGQLVTLDSLFKESIDYENFLIDEVRRQMTERRQSGQADYYQDAESQIAEVFETGGFFLTDDSLTLVYPCYTLAPFAAGTQYFEIPFSALGSLLREQLGAEHGVAEK